MDEQNTPIDLETEEINPDGANEKKAKAAAVVYLENTSVTPDTWNGKYPLTDLPVGSYWYGPYQTNNWTCVGFAKMVLDATYGAYNTIAAGPEFVDANSIKSAFTKIMTGDRVTFANRTGDDPQHATIIAAQSSTGITMYDCNREGDTMIRKTVKTWDELFARYKSILGGAHRA